MLHSEIVGGISEGLLSMAPSYGGGDHQSPASLVSSCSRLRPEASVSPHPQQSGHVGGIPGKTAQQLKQRRLLKVEQGCLHCFAHDPLFLIL